MDWRGAIIADAGRAFECAKMERMHEAFNARAHASSTASAVITVTRSSSGASIARARQTMAAPIKDPDAKLRSELVLTPRPEPRRPSDRAQGSSLAPPISL